MSSMEPVLKVFNEALSRKPDYSPMRSNEKLDPLGTL